MNDFLLIFIGIFILLLIFLVFLLLAYVYNSYTTYTVDINKNLLTSEKNINDTSTAFNKLQDNVVNELAKVNKNQIYSKYLIFHKIFVYSVKKKYNI